MADELPPVVTRLLGDVTDLEAALGRGEVAVEAFHNKVTGIGGGSSGVGEDIGREIGDGIGDGLGKELPKATDPPLDDFDEKVKNRTRSTAQAAGQGMSPLLIAAFASAAIVGPAAILEGFGIGLVGAAALIAKSNQEVSQSYQKLGADIGTTLQGAVTPVIPEIQTAVEVLDAGLNTVGPEVESLFAAVAPDAVDLADGLTGLAENALPGITTGMRDVQPLMSHVADDMDRLGAGAGGFVAALGAEPGLQGAVSGFDALFQLVEHLLPDLGQITNTVAGGLGPAFHGLVDVIDPLLDGATKLISTLSPGEIQAITGAVTGLFLAFKVAGSAQVLNEGATFLGFLKGGAVNSEALADKSGLAGKALGGMGTAVSALTGPLGLVLGSVALLGPELGNLAGVGVHVTDNVNGIAAALSQAATGSVDAQQQLNQYVDALLFAGDATGHTGEAFNQLDKALVQLMQSDPQQAAVEFDQISEALVKEGKSTSDVAGLLPQYSKAVSDAKAQTQLASTTTDQLSSALTKAGNAAVASAQQTAQNTLAALGARDGQNALNVQLDESITAYETASGQAGAYKVALDALYGKYQSYSQAEATFTTDLDNASKSLTKGKDAINLHTAAGAANFTLLSQLATANENVAQALYTQTGNQGQANKSLQDGALKIDALAKSAGFTDGQIQDLNKDLYGTASLKDIHVTVSADTSPAWNGVKTLIAGIDEQVGSVTVVENVSGGGVASKGPEARAGGGPVVRGQTYWVGETGQPELFTAGADGYITPLDMLRPATAGPGGSGGGGLAPVVNVYIDGRLVTAGVRSSAQQYKTRNAQTGLT
jgi:hypothetical protein